MERDAEIQRPARQTLQAAGLRPRKRLGQHFLRDRSVLPSMLRAARVTDQDDVLEVGAGTGLLTAALARAAHRVVAIELDDALATVLRRQFANRENVEIWHGNALAFDPCEHVSGRYILVGNIPYYITGPILRHYLEARCQPAVLVLMVQREVAERMAAPPGKLSLLGVSVQYYARAEILFRVPASAFYPRPKVESAVVRLTPHRAHSASSDPFFSMVRAGFGLKRKQLVNSLATGLGVGRTESVQLLACAGIDPTARAETLSIADWERLAACRSRLPPVQEG